MSEHQQLAPDRPARRFGSRVVLAACALALVAVPFLVLVLVVTAGSGPVITLDRRVADALHTVAVGSPAFTTAMKAISAVGSPTGWWVILTPVFLWLLLRRRFRLASFLAVTALGSSVLNTILKASVDRTRPHLSDAVASAGGSSFPSAHAQAATAGTAVLLLILLPLVPRRRRWAPVVLGVLVVVAICFSRVALGVHYLSDVVGGVVIAAAWVLATTAVFVAQRRAEPDER